MEIQSQRWGENRQLSMEGITDEFFSNSIDPGSNEKNNDFIYILLMTMNKMHVIHMLICFIYFKNDFNCEY